MTRYILHYLFPILEKEYAGPPPKMYKIDSKFLSNKKHYDVHLWVNTIFETTEYTFTSLFLNEGIVLKIMIPF